MLMTIKLFRKISYGVLYASDPNCNKTAPAPLPLASTATLKGQSKFGADSTGEEARA